MSTPTLLALAIVAASVALMLVRPRGVAEVWWVSAGALILVVTGLLPIASAGAAVRKGADVYAFLIGMMLLSELARSHGVFDWLAALAARRARGSRVRLFGIVYAVGTLVTVFMSNDATAVVLTPAILAVTRRVKVGPLPYLFVCAMVANAASFVLPVSNPANLVLFHGALPSLGRWLSAFALPSLLSIGTTYAMLRWVFRGELAGTVVAEVEEVRLSRNGVLVVVGLGVVSLVLLAASALDQDLGVPTLVAALAVTALSAIVARENPLPLFRAVSWSTLVLVAGLFVLVEAVVARGGLEATVAALRWAESLPPGAGAFVTSFVLGVGNNVVNNLPLGLVTGATLAAGPPSPALTNAALIGIDLGPNLATTGSLATILWLIALRREGIRVGFREFLKVGLWVMPASLAAATIGSLASAAIAGR